MPLQTHILTFNNADTIANTIGSISSLESDVYVIDIGSTDDTVEICRNLNIRINVVEKCENLSDIRNESLENDWILYLEPWEMLATGKDVILDICNQNKPSAYHFNVFQDTAITKEVRLWHKNLNVKFINPVFEYPQSENSQFLEKVALYSNGESKLNDVETRVENWRKSLPIAAEPSYYKAYVLMSQKKYPEFVQAANSYLAQVRSGKPMVLMTYYLASVLFYIIGDTQQAVRNIMNCIICKPTMAEFWCLLGDIYYKQDKYEKSVTFYQNAMDLGSRRENSDTWPLEIGKYKSYPLQMIDNCHKMIKQREYYKTS
ncbi:MAG: tetratricopeptide repeat protein [Candidatus Thorarchaeota archaeon]|jgi:tetratricopeptide (TPR) repeat protein